MDDLMSYGQIAYEGYCESSNGKSLISGASLPPWEDLQEEICFAWIDSAMAVRHAIARMITS